MSDGPAKSAAASPAERRRMRALFEQRERARMGLPPKAASTAERPRRMRRADAELRRLVDLGHSEESARRLADAAKAAWEALDPQEQLAVRCGLPPRVRKSSP